MQTCSKCRTEDARAGQRYCLACHAAYARANRKKYSEMSAAQKQKLKCRSSSSRATRTGVLTKQPCAVCGSDNAERHHHRYTDHLDVTWLCREHHLAAEKAKSAA